MHPLSTAAASNGRLDRPGAATAGHVVTGAGR